jgi:NAD-dependent SIR2 family protein deacetylase
MTLAAARTLLRDARRVAVLTGAGMSAESGVPTFRDALTGLWSKFDPEQLATPEAFRANPALVWRWYSERRAGVLAAQPHAGHLALARATGRFDSLAVVTQNVDGLHARAGSSEVLELHGNILHSRCLDECGVRYDHPDHLPAGAPPRCPECGRHCDPVWCGSASHSTQPCSIAPNAWRRRRRWCWLSVRPAWCIRPQTCHQSRVVQARRWWSSIRNRARWTPGAPCAAADGRAGAARAARPGLTQPAGARRATHRFHWAQTAWPPGGELT